MYGRERERAQLRELLDDAMAGHGSLVLVSGEAGIGKTTLIDDLILEARERDCLVLTGGCYDLTTTPPYGPWIEVLQAYRQNIDKFDLPAWFARPDQLNSLGSQTAVFEETRAFLTSVSGQQPLLIVLEDLHWSDVASLDAVRYVGRTVTDLPMLLLLTYRDDEVTRRDQLYRLLPSIVRESRAVRLNLQQLDSESIQHWIAQRYGLQPTNESKLLSFLMQHAEGNPFFATEVLRSMEEDQRLFRGSDGGWTLENLQEFSVPLLLQQIIAQRLERLPEEVRKLLRVAAVFGHEFAPEMLHQIAEVGEESVQDTIDLAVDARLLTLSRADNLIRFSHALIREALYEEMLPMRRRELHVRIAETLIQSASRDIDSVASHLSRAGDARAIEWLLRAGERALLVQARVTALDRFERALFLLDSQPEPDPTIRGWLLVQYVRARRYLGDDSLTGILEEAEALANSSNDRVLQALALWTSGLYRVRSGDGLYGIPMMERGIELFSNLDGDERARALRRSGIEPRNAEPLYWGLLVLTGHYRKVQSLLAMFQVDAVPENRHRWFVIAIVETTRGWLHSGLGEPAEAWRAYSNAVTAALRYSTPDQQFIMFNQAFRMETLITYRTDDTEAIAKLEHEQLELAPTLPDEELAYSDDFGLLPLLVISGQWKRAQTIVKPHARRAGHEGNYLALRIEAQVAHWTGNVERVRYWIDTLFPEGPEAPPGGLEFSSAIAVLRLAATLALDDRNPEEARRWICAYENWMKWSQRTLGKSEGELLWASYHRLTGDLERARAHAERARNYASNPRQPLALIAADRFLGQLDVDEGEHDDAAARLAASLELAERCEAPFEQALTLTVMAERAAKLNEVDEARKLIARVRRICAPLGAKPILERVTAIEAMLPRTRGHTRELPFGLTTREVEVLRLVARGMTDAEAAEELFISPRTASQHMRSVYNKLAVSNRAEATRVAVEQGIV